MMRYFSIIVVLILNLVGGVSAVESTPDGALLDVFPSSIGANASGGSSLSWEYTPSKSIWAAGLDERQVFQVELQHQQDKESSFALRVGKGGQIYSLRGAFGESVPPSWREGKDARSPWNDEVWQFVAVCTKYNGPPALQREGHLSEAEAARLKSSPFALTYFIHNSGAYIPGSSAVSSLYCPQLAESAAEQGRVYRTLNWGLVPQVRTIHRSPILYYTQVRDAGDGIIELTWVVHNFSVRQDIVFDYLNGPWGGTRATSLPLTYVSSPRGLPILREELFAKKYDGAVDVRQTGGWSLACASEAADSPSLALVYGRDKHLERALDKSVAEEERVQFAPTLFRDFRAGEPMYRNQWKDWQTRPENSFRNYDVIEVIPKLRLKPGMSIWYRSFLVVNRRDRAIELAKSLVEKVDYGQLTFEAADTPTVPVFVRDGKVVASGSEPAMKLYARPVRGAMPLFLIENAETGRQVITTDPYHFVAKSPLNLGLSKEHSPTEYLAEAQGYSMDQNNTRWRRLLGYALVSRPAAGHFKRLSEILDSTMFPAPDEYQLDLWAPRD